ncbi:MAG: hypothetical protein QXO84_01180 [Candidatus Aenigmatarchaeota archaeon]
MAEDTFTIFLAIVVGIIVLVLAYKFFITISYTSLRKTTLNEFTKFSSSIDFVCSQEVKTTYQINFNLPESVRVVYASYDENILPKVTENIKNGKISVGDNVCLHFKNEQKPRCQKVKCKVFIPYMGSLETWNDLKLFVNKILNRPLVKEYSINISKTNYGVDLIYDNYDSFKVPVLVIAYIPLNDEGNVDTTKTGNWKESDKEKLKNYLSSASENLTEFISEGSRYKWFMNSDSTRAVNYYIADVKINYKSMPTKDGNSVDVKKIMDEINVCNYVDASGIKEFWIWVYDDLKPIEFVTVLGKQAKDIWNIDYDGDGEKDYGVIGNLLSLPTCKHSYTVYNFIIGSSPGIMLSNYTHRIEATLSYLDYGIWLSFNVSCGSPDCPINVWPNCDEGWNSEKKVETNCLNWSPAGGETTTIIDCHSWYGSKCKKDDGFEYKIWWMQTLPGKNNGIKVFDYFKVKNWWSFIGNIDQASKHRWLIE